MTMTHFLTGLRRLSLLALLLPGLLLPGIPCPAAPPPAPMQTLHPAPAPGPLDNPLKGWCVYTIAGPIRQPYSMVFHYVPWKTLEPVEGDYRFADWERTWDDPIGKGKRVVFRVYLDYPGLPSGVPDWLARKGVTRTPYKDYGGGLSPDYDHPALAAGLEKLIAALGRRYDTDPRIAFVQIGLLGFWGEGHTYPRPELFASAATQKRVLDAYQKAFPDKVLMARYPSELTAAQPALGFHDDLFPDDTDPSIGWHFLARLAAAGCADRWRRAALGGEMVPGGAGKWVAGDGFAHTMEMVTQGHFSWIGPYGPAEEPEQTPALTAHSQALVRRLGYEFRLSEVRLPRQVATGGRLSCLLRGRNQGVAPFPYPWPVELALLDARGAVVQTMPQPDDIRRWQPGAFTLQASEPVTARPGRYALALGIRDPWTKRPAVGFANALPRTGGWTLLGPVTVTIRGRQAALPSPAVQDGRLRQKVQWKKRSYPLHRGG